MLFKFISAFLAAIFFGAIAVIVLFPSTTWLHNYTLTLVTQLELSHGAKLIYPEFVLTSILSFFGMIILAVMSVAALKSFYSGKILNSSHSVAGAAVGGLLMSLIAIFILVLPIDLLLRLQIFNVTWVIFMIFFIIEWITILILTYKGILYGANYKNKKKGGARGRT